MSTAFDFPDIATGMQQIAKDSLGGYLESKRYAPTKVQEWMDAINTTCIDRLKELSPNFKFVSSCIIMQKLGTGLHYDCAAHWDVKTDGCLTTKFENDTIVAILTVFGIAI
jgi:dynein light chain Tctex-type 1